MNTRPKIVSLGEVLWDLFPAGAILGGAPANFACHAGALGADAALVSRVGRDELGTQALVRLRDYDLNLSAISVDSTAATGTVEVKVATDGQPQYVIRTNAAWDSIAADDAAMRLASVADAVCFGTLAQREPGSRSAISRILAATRRDALRIFDINLRAPFYTPEVIQSSLESANVLKLNETELPVLAAQFGLVGSSDHQLEELARRFRLDVIALTLGAAGSRVLRGGVWTSEPGRKVKVKDAVGAGDSFTAALVLGLLRGWPTPKILAAATDIAAYVCTQPGATPELPPELVAPFSNLTSA